MKTLAQTRALSAWKLRDVNTAGAEGGAVLKRLPAMVMRNGLLTTLWSAVEKNGEGQLRNKGMWGVMAVAAKHCKDMGITKSEGPEELKAELGGGNSELLRAATREIMAWLAFAKRVPSPKNAPSPEEAP